MAWEPSGNKPFSEPMFTKNPFSDQPIPTFMFCKFSSAFSWMKMFEFHWPKISLTFVPKGPINNIPTLVQVMAWHRPGDKPLSEPMVVNLLTHICVTRPQWVKWDVFQMLVSEKLPHFCDTLLVNLHCEIHHKNPYKMQFGPGKVLEKSLIWIHQNVWETWRRGFRNILLRQCYGYNRAQPMQDVYRGTATVSSWTWDSFNTNKPSYPCGTSHCMNKIAAKIIMV